MTILEGESLVNDATALVVYRVAVFVAVTAGILFLAGVKMQYLLLPDGTIRLERPQAHQFIPQLIESLPALITSCSIAKPTLEDVFIHLTGHGFKDDAEG